jgi:alkanesulfonate monooxygenase SsuD/methylene tetrahydromethanopterin reductase-like flavin-dependent oxidoreductase (luciferase family)
VKVRFALSVGLRDPNPDALARVCTAAEATGFDTLWLSDVPSQPSTEPTLGVAYAAAVTTRVRLGINLIPFGSTPYVIAHRMAQLDHLTRGRLLITLVPGLDLPGEREALGTAGRHRGRMMEEVVPQLRSLWAGGLPVGPVQDPLEIWLGGSGPDAIGRAGRVADGWLGSLVSPPRAGQIRAAIQAEAAVAGRTVDPEHFGLSIGYARDASAMEAAASSRLRTIRARRPDLDPGAEPSDLVPVGAEALQRLVTRLTEEGLSKFVLRPLGPVADWDAELSWLAEAVLGLQT